MQRGRHGFLGGQEPVGLGQDGRNDVRKIEAAGHQENLLDLPRAAPHHQNPDGHRGQRHGNVFADSKNLHGRRHAGEFRDGIAQVNGEGGQHHEERGAEAEFLADQIGEAFAGDHAHARAHFLADVEGNGHGNQRPQHGVAELGARNGVGGDAARVVVHVGSDEPRTDHRQKHGEAPAVGARAAVQLLAAGHPGRERVRQCDPGVHSDSLPLQSLRAHPAYHVVHRDGADRAVLAVHDDQAAQIVFVEQLENVFIVCIGGDREQGSKASSAIRWSELASTSRAIGTVPASLASRLIRTMLSS